MFDENKEPEDIFADVDKTPKSAPPGAQPPGMPARAAGGAQPPQAAVRHGPSKLIFIVAVLVVLLLVGGGVWFAFFRGHGGSAPTLATAPATQGQGTQQPAPSGTSNGQAAGQGTTTLTPPTQQAQTATAANCGNGTCDPGEDATSCPADCAPKTVCGNGKCEAGEDSTSCPADCPVPAPQQPAVTSPEPANQSVDSDGDGLSDAEEAKLGTNPHAVDTDNDGLTDYEEVKIYGTDPLNPDTDGDGYLDGEEVKNGYNPLGPGKLFKVPSSTSTSQ